MRENFIILSNFFLQIDLFSARSVTGENYLGKLYLAANISGREMTDYAKSSG